MKAARIHKFGGPEVVKYETNVPKPTVGETQVLFRVSAAGINPADVYATGGYYPVFTPSLPWIPGWDAAGVVEAVGKKVKRFKKGDRVFCAGNVSGGYAEYVVSEEGHTGHLDTKLTFAQGASVGVPYYTAWRAIITQAKAKAGETVLIHGASGAVGLASVHLCKHLGLRVLGTAGTDKGMTLVKDNGADEAFNHRKKGYENKIKTSLGGQGVDIILEMVANVNLQKDLELLNKAGRVIIIGTRGPETTIDPAEILLKETIVQGVNLPNASEAEWAEMSMEVEKGMAAGWVRPVVAKEYPLSQAGQAQKDIMDTTGAVGNLVLTM